MGIIMFYEAVKCLIKATAAKFWNLLHKYKHQCSIFDSLHLPAIFIAAEKNVLKFVGVVFKNTCSWLQVIK